MLGLPPSVILNEVKNLGGTHVYVLEILRYALDDKLGFIVKR